MKDDQIKRLFQEAGELHKQATAIVEEFAGKDMPAEKKSEADRLLDQCQAKSEQAQQMVRAEEQRKKLEGYMQVPEAARPHVFTVKGNTTPEMEMKAAAHRAAQVKFWMTGDNTELKALSIGSQTSGGYLAADTTSDELIEGLNEYVAMRRISRVLPAIPAGSYITPTAAPLADADDNSETGEVDFDVVEPFGDRRLTPHEIDRGVLVSTALMRNPRFNIEAWILEQATQSIGRRQERNFILGNGSSRAMGILNTVGLTYHTTDTANAIYGDDIINWIYKLPAAYAASAKARILCNRSFIRKVRTQTKANAATDLQTYIWQPALAPNAPATLDGVPYEFSDKMPTGLTTETWDNNAVPAIYGDFDKYWIVDGLEVYVQRLVEKYATTKQVGFLITSSVDGMCVQPDAFIGLKVKSS
ncbi:MAG: phage major capsid protein [Chloroflexi bacterium]|nr:phage major capsid protein [Chloroflexota bacterium]